MRMHKDPARSYTLHFAIEDSLRQPSILHLLYKPPPALMLAVSSCSPPASGPFCQISSDPTALPQGLRDPPAYSPPPSPRPAHATLTYPPDSEDPPAYSASKDQADSNKGEHTNALAGDVLHFISPAHDTIFSLALRYAVPSNALRKKNNLYADHLLAARKAILIPGEFYKGGVSLSPQPIDGEEEELRKSKIRRWMVACKVSE
ncbi:MAG: hypothetical protein Q9218_004576 [Villophora microphyllina]